MTLIPTFEEAKEIVSQNKNFFMKEEILPDSDDSETQVFIFGHRLASYSDFFDKNDEETKALELRGITYVNNNGIMVAYPALRKFFNINQTKGSMVEDVEHLRITNIQDKLDGSMINFVRTNADGKIRAKSKMTFYSEQARMATRFVAENPNYEKFINNCFDRTFGRRFFPVFELVSPWNKIVLDYRDTKLVLLQVRDEFGRPAKFYRDDWADYLHANNIETAEVETGALSDLLVRAENETNIEGWVVTFGNGKQVKVKTKWYFEMHKLITEHVTAENVLIEMTLRETIDDALSKLDKNDERRQYAEKVVTAFSHWFNENVDRVESILKFEAPDMKRKQFALKYNGDPMFSVIMRSLNKPESVAENMKEMMLKRFRKLGEAQAFCKKVLKVERTALTY